MQYTTLHKAIVVTHQTDANFLDVKHLRLFDLLYSTHSVTRSSELLGQSQPTVSISLAKLRKELGDPLFIRTANEMQPHTIKLESGQKHLTNATPVSVISLSIHQLLDQHHLVV